MERFLKWIGLQKSILFMNNDLEIFIRNPRDYSFSSDIQKAVRYGYQYRVANGRNDFCCFISLPPLPGIISWLANAIFSGITYDCFKGLARNAYDGLRKNKKKLSPLVNRVLSNPDEVARLYKYFKEIKDKQMNTTPEDEARIKEGFVADVIDREAKKIYEKDGRFLSNDEIKRLTDMAFEAADAMIAEWKSGLGRDEKS